jgi:hypothetical protein
MDRPIRTATWAMELHFVDLVVAHTVDPSVIMPASGVGRHNCGWHLGGPQVSYMIGKGVPQTAGRSVIHKTYKNLLSIKCGSHFPLQLLVNHIDSFFFQLSCYLHIYDGTYVHIKFVCW